MKIMTKSSPVFKKKAEQDSLMNSRHKNQNFNSRFKIRGKFSLKKKMKMK